MAVEILIAWGETRELKQQEQPFHQHKKQSGCFNDIRCCVFCTFHSCDEVILTKAKEEHYELFLRIYSSKKVSSTELELMVWTSQFVKQLAK